MMVAKILAIVPAFAAVVGVSSMLDRGVDAPLFVKKPAAANMAVVPQPDATGRPRALHGEQMRYSRAADGLFYVHGKVNGVPVRFVLDTGATLVVLTAEDARRVGLNGLNAGPAQSMETASGSSSIRRVRIDEVKVAGHAIGDVDAAVAHDGLKTSLLGQNLLAQLGTITLSEDEVELH